MACYCVIRFLLVAIFTITNLHQVLTRSHIKDKYQPNVPCSNVGQFRKAIKTASKIVIITGDGLSEESLAPTFLPTNGFWDTYQEDSCQSVRHFNRNPSFVWQFVNYLRKRTLRSTANVAHRALVELQDTYTSVEPTKPVHIITHSPDSLFDLAGALDVLELHGSVFRTLCMNCLEVATSRQWPLCEALSENYVIEHDIPDIHLPRCPDPDCNGLLLPYVYFYPKYVPGYVMRKAREILENTTLCIVVGLSIVAYQEMIAEMADNGVTVAEFDTKPTALTRKCKFFFRGQIKTTLPKIFRVKRLQNERDGVKDRPRKFKMGKLKDLENFKA